jgi:hypothetical protein
LHELYKGVSEDQDRASIRTVARGKLLRQNRVEGNNCFLPKSKKIKSGRARASESTIGLANPRGTMTGANGTNKFTLIQIVSLTTLVF